MAYQVCKTLEAEEQQPLPNADHRPEGISPNLPPGCAARVLGFALLYPPSEAGRDNLATEILGCNNDCELLTGLASLYVFGLIGLCTSSVAFWPLSC